MSARARPRLALVTLAGLTSVAALAGCGTNDPPLRAAAPSGTPSAATSAAPAATGTGVPTESAPPFRADTNPDESGTDGGGGLGVTSVRVARQDGYDRVVFELAGTGTPGWRFAYVDTPTQDGSGTPFKVPGDAFLQVSIRGVGYPSDTGVPAYAGPKLVTGSGTAQVQGVAVGSVFEGAFDGAIGIAGPKRPFRVFALTNPTRVVVDVRDR